MRSELNGISCLALTIAGVGMVVPSIAAAQEAPRPEIRISGGLEASSNPFVLEQGEEALAAYITVDPTIFIEEGRHTTVVDGSLRATQYFNEYGTDANGRLRLSTRRALSERTGLELSASIASTRRNFLDGLADADTGAPLDPTALPDAAVVDPTLIGALVRSTTISATGAFEHQITPVSSVTANAAYSRTTFSNDAGQNVRGASASLAYGRRIAPQTVVSLGGQFATFNFDGEESSDANVYTLQARLEHEIGTRWQMAVGAGIDLVDRDLGLGGQETNSLLSGNISLCNAGLRARFCVTGNRAAQPTAVGGISTVTSIGVSYNLTLSENDRLTFNSQFGRSKLGLDSGLATAGDNVDVIGATANYMHDLSDRAALFVTVGYSDLSDDLRDVPSNAFVRIGITLGFGRRR